LYMEREEEYHIQLTNNFHESPIDINDDMLSTKDLFKKMALSENREISLFNLSIIKDYIIPKLKIVCIGPPGVGKSTLLNHVFGFNFVISDNYKQGTLMDSSKTKNCIIPNDEEISRNDGDISYHNFNVTYDNDLNNNEKLGIGIDVIDCKGSSESFLRYIDVIKKKK